MSKSGGESHASTAVRLAVIVVAMFGFGYLMVPIYDVFCEITGLNGKTGRVAEAEVAKRYGVDTERLVTVEFVAVNNGDMSWDFEPHVEKMQVHPGKIYAAAYTAVNSTSKDMVGQAVPSVAPLKASLYFDKTECFCFTKQALGAGESKEMPLRFIVNPDLPDDINTLTLAYTFFDVSEENVN